MFRKILIANRGEIAIRVLRACREMGLAAAAVYSNVDRKSLHVRLADEAYPIGPAPATESYLRIDKLLEVARKSDCDALHPGYGFLAENPALARACRGNGIVFIGPSPEAMERMGSKTAARKIAASAGVPVVPGMTTHLESLEQARQLASEFGYPFMFKAAAGGGGKGMRLVRTPDELPAAFRDAQSEAKNAFNDPALYIEKYLECPRHIEMQILGDEHGNVVYLGERECSIQRRHQKVIEESPSPIMTPELRAQMGEAAVRLVKAAGYTNAGTPEFLVVESSGDGEPRLKFYFLEMNARLQVEHTVTELVTGLDLVKLQIAVAAGEKLPFAQSDVALRGAAMELRVYAEDPDNNFFPSPGTVTYLRRPLGPGIRLDECIFEGWTVPLEYDPLLGKMIAWGNDRQEAILRLKRGLEEYAIGGIKTNLSFFRQILDHPDFLAGRLDTGLVDRMLAERGQKGEDQRENLERLAALAAVVFECSTPSPDGASGVAGRTESRWKIEGRQALLDRRPRS